MLDKDSNFLGDFSLKEGLSKAKAKNLDLVLVNIAHKPPICKIYDYSGDLLKAFKNAKKKKVESLKEENLSSKTLILGSAIKASDLQTKANMILTHGKRAQNLVVNIISTDETQNSSRSIIENVRDFPHSVQIPCVRPIFPYWKFLQS